MKTIIINGIEFPLKFGYGCFKMLGEMWGVDTFQGVIEKLSVLAGLNEAAIGFSHIDLLIDMVRASVFAAPGNAFEQFNEGDCGDFLMANPNVIADIVKAMVASLPNSAPAATEGKPKTLPKVKAPEVGGH